MISLLFRLILFVTGWSYPDAPTVRKLKDNPKVIVVISHTSYADFWIMVLFRIAYPSLFEGVRFAVKPGPFKNYSFLLDKLGCIKCTSRDKKNGGAVEQISNEINSMEECKFFISPKGTIVKEEWRSGYYHIAVKTKSCIIASGFDYEKKTFVMTEVRNVGTKTYQEMTKIVKQDLSQIVPLNKEWSEVDFKCENPGLVSILSWTKFSSFVCCMFCELNVVMMDEWTDVMLYSLIVALGFLFFFNDCKTKEECLQCDMYIMLSLCSTQTIIGTVSCLIYYMCTVLMLLKTDQLRSKIFRPAKSIMYVLLSIYFVIYLKVL